MKLNKSSLPLKNKVVIKISLLAIIIANLCSLNAAELLIDQVTGPAVSVVYQPKSLFNMAENSLYMANDSELVRYIADNNIDKVNEILSIIENSSIRNTLDLNKYFYLLKSAHSREMIEFLFKKSGLDVNINKLNNKAQSALIIASKFENEEVVTFLLENGAETNVKAKNGDTALLKACHKKNIKIVDLLLKKGANINEIYSVYDKSTLLQYLCCNDQCAEVIEFLLKNNASIDIKNNKGMTPLHIACLKGCKENVRMLLNNGAQTNINAQDLQGDTALHRAVDCGHLEIVQLLLTYGADVTKINNREETALTIGFRLGKLDIIKKLIEHNGNVDAIVNHRGQTALHLASEFGCFDITKWLIDHGATRNIKDAMGNTALHTAYTLNRLDIVKLLISLSSNAIEKKNTMTTTLYVASSLGHLEIVKWIIDYNEIAHKDDKINIHAMMNTRKTALHTALSYANLEIARLLINAGIDINQFVTFDHVGTVGFILNEKKDTLTPDAFVNLFQFVKSEMMAEMLLKKELFHVNTRNKYGQTILHIVCSNGTTEGIVQKLLDKDIDINAKDANCRTALQNAAFSRREDIVQRLLKKDVDINAEDEFGQTALHLTIFNGSENIVRMLLDNDAAINSKNKNGDTALHLAVMYQNLPIVKQLISAGADVTIQNNEGKTSRQIKSSREISVYLRKMKGNEKRKATDDE